MKLTCPACGATHSLEALLTDQQAREAVAAALALPAPLNDRLLRYIGLFRPPKRALSWERATRLLTELRELIHAGSIERKGRTWPAPIAYWSLALDAVLEQRAKLQLPLTGHGYLLEILCGVAFRAEHRDEVEKERRCANAPRQGAAKTVAEVVAGSAPKRAAGPPPNWRDEAQRALGRRPTTGGAAAGTDDDDHGSTET